MIKRFALYSLVVVILASCRKDNEGPLYRFEAPSYFPAKVYNPTFDSKKFELGRKLFYDPILSEGNTISCADCHQQFAGFAHLDHKVSHGIDNKNGTRNSPAMSNLAWSPTFMWDGGINHLEVLPLAPITNPVEMNLPIADAIAKLNASSTYKELFRDAFGTTTITDYHLFKSLGMFMGNMVSANSKYDQYRKGDINALSDDEKAGMNLFNNKCASCHIPPLFTSYGYENNGLDSEFSKDQGRAHITQLAEDMGKFRVPSLRNVALSRPYMHDGRLETLEEVIDHYSTGIKQSATLSPLLQNSVPLSADEKNKLVLFLKALTDNEYVNNPLYGRP